MSWRRRRSKIRCQSCQRRGGVSTSYETHAHLPIKIPVRHCRRCGFSFTDAMAERFEREYREHFYWGYGLLPDSVGNRRYWPVTVREKGSGR